VETANFLDAIELIAASAWGTEAALRAVERGDLAAARTLLEDCRRPLLQGLRDLRRELDRAHVEVKANASAERALAEVTRLQEIVEQRLAS
jgi:hypothetical protein